MTISANTATYREHRKHKTVGNFQSKAMGQSVIQWMHRKQEKEWMTQNAEALAQKEFKDTGNTTTGTTKKKEMDSNGHANDHHTRALVACYAKEK